METQHNQPMMSNAHVGIHIHKHIHIHIQPHISCHLNPHAVYFHPRVTKLWNGAGNCTDDDVSLAEVCKASPTCGENTPIGIVRNCSSAIAILTALGTQLDLVCDAVLHSSKEESSRRTLADLCCMSCGACVVVCYECRVINMFLF